MLRSLLKPNNDVHARRLRKHRIGPIQICFTPFGALVA
jgi:hypothetical protein